MGQAGLSLSRTLWGQPTEGPADSTVAAVWGHFLPRLGCHRTPCAQPPPCENQGGRHGPRTRVPGCMWLRKDLLEGQGVRRPPGPLW